MLKKTKGLLVRVNVKCLSSIAAIALIISTVAVNQRCWYVMHEEEIPEGCKKLRRF